MASKAQVKRTIDELGEALGLDVRGGVFRVKTATGMCEGASVYLRVGSSADVVGYSDQVEAASLLDGDPGTIRVSTIKGETRYFVRAVTRHAPLGLGLRIQPTPTPVEQRATRGQVLTGDSVFDDALSVTAEDVDAAQRFLTGPIRSTIQAFFDAGASAVIGDDEIEVVAQGSTRVLAPQIRNAARMSAALE
jgi:hypothetical protein